MQRLILTLAGGALALGLAASAAAQPQTQGRQCFSSTSIRGVQPVGDRQVNVRVDTKDVFRIDLTESCFGLRQPQRVIDLSPVASGVSMCSGADIRLGVSVDGFRSECFIGSVTRLSPGEVAALANRERP
ncbi:MAG TPA: DUF6491 family protein [Caulobacteraceae bacterium]|jgi:hypothetical protein|nr:DUF6491 family protein [Caulobacteraceae bacterium]